MSVPLFSVAILLAGPPQDAGIPAVAPLSTPAPPQDRQPSAPIAPPPILPPQGTRPATPPQSTPPPAPGIQTSDTDDDEPTLEDIVVTGRQRDTPGDPLEAINAQSFAATQAVDKAIVAPASRAYRRVLPLPIRSGISNFLTHLREPSIFLNFLLQLKFGKAAETLARFAINSTIGVVGVFDVAKRRPFNLPHRRNGFANTMGFYGIERGPFLFLPLIGPTTLRDFIGDSLDRLVLPLAVGKPFNETRFTLPISLLSALDFRAEFDGKLKEIRAQSDPYTAAREYYLYRRQAEIDQLRGRPTVGGTLTRPVDYPLPPTAVGEPVDAAPEAVLPEKAAQSEAPVPDARSAPPAAEPPVTATPDAPTPEAAVPNM